MLHLACILGMTTQLLQAAAAAPEVPKTSEMGQKALAVLAAEMNDKDADVRQAAASAWGRIGNATPGPIKLLHKALRDKNAHVRIEAAYSLHLLGDEWGLGAIVRIVRPSTTPVEAMEPEEQAQLISRAKSRVHGVERLSEIGGADVVDIFDKLQNDPAGEVRDAVNIALARMGLGPEFEKPFLDAVNDPDENLRAAALRALAQIGDGPALDALNSVANDHSVLVREEAMRACAKFSGPDTVGLLAKGAKDPDKRVAAQALSGLARIPDGRTVDLLREMLKNSKAPEVNLKAEAGLARRGDKVSLDLSDWALKQKDPDMRALGLDVLEAMTTQQSDALLLRTLESDRDGKLRVQAATILVMRLARREGSAR